MSDITLKEALRKVFNQQDREQALVYRHSARTPACPPLVRFFSGATAGWTSEEREHVSSCSYCQMTIGQVWVERPPSLGRFAEYVLSPDSFPDREAMRYYLAHAGGRLEALVRSLLRSRGLLAHTTEAAVAQLATLRAAFGGLPDAPRALAAASPSLDPEILLERYDHETGLAFGLRTDSQGTLQAFIRRLDMPVLYHACYRFWVYGPTEPLHVELAMGDTSEAYASLGPAAALLPQIGTACLVVLETAGDSK